MDPVQAIGLMSGTSLDGIDVAALVTDGEEIERFGPTGYRPYGEDERALLRRALAAAANLRDRTERPALLAEAEDMVTQAHAAAVEAFLAANGIACSDVATIGFHGQTVLHRPDVALTVQLGSGADLAHRLGIPVVCDFRGADMAAGGQGAPLVPVYHQALIRHLDVRFPVAVVNIGGVANVTFADRDGTLVACDTGPGNALLDDFVRLRMGLPHDPDGRVAAAGRVNDELLTRILSHSYFRQVPPKSLDRNEFRGWIAQQGGLDGASTEDGAATLTAVTATSIAAAAAILPAVPATWIVAGGGSHNPALMRMLTRIVAPAPVLDAAAVGWSADALEAQAFALLAVRSLRGLPLTFPGTTGVARPTNGGVLFGRPAGANPAGREGR